MVVVIATKYPWWSKRLGFQLHPTLWQGENEKARTLRALLAKSLLFQSSPFIGEGGSRGMGLKNLDYKETLTNYPEI
jgi:hypothetical protein